MGSEYFVLEIISPTNNQRLSVEWVEIESPTGSFFVGPHHMPLVSIIKKKSPFLYKQIGEKTPQSFIIHEGFFRVSSDHNAAVVLTS
jgi:F0F1-type ATP synthase epsilon subunit